MTLSETEQLLPAHFIRSHRSFLVNKNLIQKAERHQLKLGKFFVPISSSYVEEVLEKIKTNS